MKEQGGPDDSELDAEVYQKAQEAAEWWGPILKDMAERASGGPAT